MNKDVFNFRYESIMTDCIWTLRALRLATIRDCKDGVCLHLHGQKSNSPYAAMLGTNFEHLFWFRFSIRRHSTSYLLLISCTSAGSIVTDLFSTYIWSRDIICLHILLHRKKFLCSKKCKQIMSLDQMRDPIMYIIVLNQQFYLVEN